MAAKHTPEFKKLMGHREADNDGFTYPYGKYKTGSPDRNSASLDQQIRQDKRAVKAKEAARIKKEEE